MNQQTYLILQNLHAFAERVMKSDKLSDYERYDHLFSSGTFRLVSQLDDEFCCPEDQEDLKRWWDSFSSQMEKLNSIAPFPT